MGGYYYGKEVLEDLIGHKITEIYMDDSDLGFTTSDGTRFQYYVDGDCCSYSYFHDFHGVDKLLMNGPVVSVHEVELDEPDQSGHECLQAYGYSIVTEHPVWGEQTSVFSFRNESNGYYGGDINRGNPTYTDSLLWVDVNRLTQDKY